VQVARRDLANVAGRHGPNLGEPARPGTRVRLPGDGRDHHA
jgi:hypothetical protein